MDQKRLIIAIAISIAILLGFQWIMPRPHPVVTQQTASETAPGQTVPAPGPGSAMPPPNATAKASVPREVPRLNINAPRVRGSISLLGARLDDIVLRDYREEPNPTSPQVQLLEPKSESQPYYVQFGWSAPAGSTVKLPDSDTLWTASGNELGVDKPVTLTWDNGAGLVFEIALAIDDNFMFTAQQRVLNKGATPVSLYPWSRINRDYTPAVLGTYVLHEGMVGWLDGHLKEVKYSDAKSEAQKNNGAPAFSEATTGGWGGITDKYWLVALVPDQSVPQTSAFRYANEGGDSYQMYMVTQQPEQIAPGGQGQLSTRVFTGAKEVHLLDRYETRDHIPNFSYAVDFGWFFFLTKPFFYAIDWLNNLLGNFGLAIMVFTVGVKALFFPLANKSYRSMSKMKLLGPKIQALRDQYKDDPAKLQSATMQLYKTEKVNPVSGCLPMVIQIPVFFSLYKVIYTTIEMRQAPFFGWIRDLSVPDSTNVFNLFGLLPFDPTHIAPFLHLGAWPLIMGFTMFMQQKLNPPPPDPIQAKVFQFMPLLFMFMLANFPAGLVIYWSWNNTLTIAQQWLIMRQTRLAKPSLART
jgi:YidC/Oxa1 family membrane protein insertase